MKAMILPILLGLAGLAVGAGAGHFLRPKTDPATHADEGGAEVAEAAKTAAEPETPPEYVKLNNQFVIPVLDEGRVASLVILSLGLEVEPGQTETVFAHEPKLRDGFLQVLFSHANSGGFKGSFTDAANLVPLRKALRESALGVLPGTVRDVLISDIARQDS